MGLISAEAAGTVQGSVSGPEQLIGNGSSGLIGNGSSGLIGNGSSGYRLVRTTQGGTDAGVAGGFVYLTDPTGRLYVTSERKLYGTLTDDAGRFDLAVPATDSVTINVVLQGNRRLTAVADTRAGSGPVKVDLASTLVTEYLRAKSIEHGFTFARVFGTPAAAEALKAISGLTGPVSQDPAVLAGLKPEYLTLAGLPLLRQRYAVAMGTAPDGHLGSQWTSLLKAVASDPAAPPIKYRPIAVTMVDSGIQHLFYAGALVVDPTGTLFHFSTSYAGKSQNQLRSVSPSGEKKLLFSVDKLRKYGWGSSFDDAHRLPDGRILFSDGVRGIIAAYDPSGPQVSRPNLDREEAAAWVNPRLVVDLVKTGGAEEMWSFAVDDLPNPGIYFADETSHTIWYVPDALNRAPDAKLSAPFAGVVGEPASSASLDLPATTLADLRFNAPTAIEYHRHGGVPYLYVADSDAQILIEINIQTGAVRKLAGVLPAANAAGERKAACYGAAENGADARQANLNFPYHMRFDHQERLVVIDMDNLLLRRIDPYSSPPRIWTIAGRPAVQDEACGQKNPRQTSGLEEGEARHVSIGMPNGMAFTADGHLYVADLIDSVIRKVWLGADR